MPPDSLGNASGFAMILSGNSLRIRFQRDGFSSAFRARFLRDVLSQMQGFEKPVLAWNGKRVSIWEVWIPEITGGEKTINDNET